MLTGDGKVKSEHTGLISIHPVLRKFLFIPPSFVNFLLTTVTNISFYTYKDIRDISHT